MIEMFHMFIKNFYNPKERQGYVKWRLGAILQKLDAFVIKQKVSRIVISV